MLTLGVLVLGAGVPLLFHGALPVAAPPGPVIAAPAGTVTSAPPGPVTSTAPGSAAVVSSASVTASLTVPTTTVRAGASMSATITVENNSGRPIRVLGCGPVYGVLLVGRGHHPSASWPLCAQEITLPTGRSTYPVTVAATYHECSMNGGRGSQPCTQDGSMPALPAGSYQATTVSVSPYLPVPAPVPVTVTP
jgi:hypothetical protein